MKKEHDLSLRRLAFLKSVARKVGYETKAGFVEAVKDFYNTYKIWNCNLTGKQWEIVVLFVLGVMQASLKERGYRFWICVDEALDAAQIDVEINQHPIQLKICFSEAATIAIQDTLYEKGITVVNAARGADGIEVFREILEAAGFSEEEVDREVDINPGFDAAAEVVDWFMQGIEL